MATGSENVDQLLARIEKLEAKLKDAKTNIDSTNDIKIVILTTVLFQLGSIIIVLCQN